MVTSPRHQKVIEMLSKRPLNTFQVASVLKIPRRVVTTLLHYMEERGMVRRSQVGRAGKRGYPAVWRI